MVDRRAFFSSGLASLALLRAARAASGPPGRSESAFWRHVQDAFDVDRSMVNLNSGGCSPSARAVHEAYVQELTRANRAPAWVLWREQAPIQEAVRLELATEAGCDPEELALVRNTSEGLQIVQQGIDLQAGDEVVHADVDYPRMRDTWTQRARREGIVVREVELPLPLTDPQALIDAYAAAVNRKTRVVHVSHVVFLNGQVLPVQELCAWARERGLVTVVDGAHAFGHVPVNLAEIGCDYYATSLHKWLMAPIGTGFLYVRRERIEATWALQPTAPARDGDIRKFEEVGTHPEAGHNAVLDALAFHRLIGLERKNARLRWLRAYWSDALRGLPGVVLRTSDEARYGGGFGLVDIGGREPGDLARSFWERDRVFVTPIVHKVRADLRGIRVSPNVFTTTAELDRFIAVATELATA